MTLDQQDQAERLIATTLDLWLNMQPLIVKPDKNWLLSETGQRRVRGQGRLPQAWQPQGKTRSHPKNRQLLQRTTALTHLRCQGNLTAQLLSGRLPKREEALFSVWKPGGVPFAFHPYNGHTSGLQLDLKIGHLIVDRSPTKGR